MELITFGDVKANLTGALLLSGFGLFFSVMVYCLMVYPSMRREEYRTYEGFSKRSGMIAGLVILLMFAAGGCYTYLSPFFEIRVEHSQLNLLYHVPPRTITLAREDIERIVRHSEPTKGGMRVSLRVLARGGEVYESAQLKPADFDAPFRRLERWLADGISTK